MNMVKNRPLNKPYNCRFQPIYVANDLTSRESCTMVVNCPIAANYTPTYNRVVYEPGLAKNPTRNRAFPGFDSLAAQGSHLHNSEATGGRSR